MCQRKKILVLKDPLGWAREVAQFLKADVTNYDRMGGLKQKQPSHSCGGQNPKAEVWLGQVPVEALAITLLDSSKCAAWLGQCDFSLCTPSLHCHLLLFLPCLSCRTKAHVNDFMLI